MQSTVELSNEFIRNSNRYNDILYQIHGILYGLRQWCIPHTVLCRNISDMLLIHYKSERSLAASR